MASSKNLKSQNIKLIIATLLQSVIAQYQNPLLKVVSTCMVGSTTRNRSLNQKNYALIIKCLNGHVDQVLIYTVTPQKMIRGLLRQFIVCLCQIEEKSHEFDLVDLSSKNIIKLSIPNQLQTYFSTSYISPKTIKSLLSSSKVLEYLEIWFSSLKIIDSILNQLDCPNSRSLIALQFILHLLRTSLMHHQIKQEDSH